MCADAVQWKYDDVTVKIRNRGKKWKNREELKKKKKKVEVERSRERTSGRENHISFHSYYFHQLQGFISLVPIALFNNLNNKVVIPLLNQLTL